MTPTREYTYRHRTERKIQARCDRQKSIYDSLPQGLRPKPKVCPNPSCQAAGKLQPPENFRVSKVTADGLSICCRFCWHRNSLAKEVVNKLRELASKEHKNKKSAKWVADNPQKAKIFQMNSAIRRYGVSPEWYVAKLSEQKGKCAVCDTNDPGRGGRFYIDHDHHCCSQRKKRCCGKCVRGLLCSSCNLRLAALEMAEWLPQAEAYLARYK
jgi:hypothetical protein